MNRWIALVISVVVCWAAAMACSGSGMPTVAPPPDPAFSVEHQQNALAALKTGDLATAKSEYGTIIAGNQGTTAKSVISKSLKFIGKKDLSNADLVAAMSDYEKQVAGTPNDPQANFGLGLMKLAFLGEGDVATAILAKFGQPPLKTTLVVGPDGFLAKLDKNHQLSICTTPSLKEFPFGNLPKMYTSVWDPSSPYQYLASKFHKADKAKKIFGTLLGQATQDLTSADIQKALLDVEPVLKEIVAEWELAEKDPDFSFTLPKELFYSNDDLIIKHADLSLGISALYAVLAAADFANSWTADMALGKLIDTKGATGKIGNTLMQKKDIVPILNKFFALKSDNHLADAKTNLQKALQKGQDALQQYLKGAAGAAIVVSDVNKGGVQELLTRVNEALASFDKNTDISNTVPLIWVNLGYLFANPPDANKIDIDPFVLEAPYAGGGKIKPVESFFQKLTEGVSSISMSNLPKNVISNAIRSKIFREITFATFINLFKDPQYPSCKASSGTSKGGGTPACVPKCDGMVCGDDGCGGKCGVCGDPCIPKCDGKKCGDDGCGGVCTCGAGSACVAATGQCGLAPTFIGIDKSAVLEIPKSMTKSFDLVAKSDVGLSSVTLKCESAQIKAVPIFDPATMAGDVYSFKMQISNVIASGACSITATDTAKQVTSVTFVVTPQ